MADLEKVVTVTFNYTGTLQTFTVPPGVSSVTIQAIGAAGGNSVNPDADVISQGGLGASIQGDFPVTPGDTLAILVGGMGGSNNPDPDLLGDGSGGGGGGSFVWVGQTPNDLNAGTLLVAAGGGGGGANAQEFGDGLPGLDAVDTPDTFGGSNGNGGNGGIIFEYLNYNAGGGGGGGIFSSGGNSNTFNGTVGGGGGTAINMGGNGGNGGTSGGGQGGFGGGGGGAGGDFDGLLVWGRGGGGGGYSGGGGGDDAYAGGGGGGSLNNGTNQINTTGVSTVDGNGIVIISYPCIPEMTLEIIPIYACTYLINGTVTCSGTPVAGVSVSFTTSIEGSGSVAINPTTTDAGGIYESIMTMEPGTNGTVTVTASTTVNTTPVSITETTSVNCPAPTVLVKPTSIDFGNQLVNTISSPQTITVTNTGTADLIISSAAITGPTDFQIVSNTCSTVTPGASCTIQVTFTPTSTGSKSATLDIFDNASDSPQRVSLNGNGIGTPISSVFPTSIDFGNQLVNTTSSPQTITVTNTGTADLIISNVAITGSNPTDFQVVSNMCSTVTTGNSCTIQVSFTPTATGTRTATLNIIDNASNSPQQVSLSGDGTPSAYLSITKLAPLIVPIKGNKKQITYNITVVNNGPDIANNVVVTDTLACSTTFVSANTSQGTFTTTKKGNTQTVTFMLGTILAGASASMTIVVTARSSATNISNTATVSSSTYNLNPNHSSTIIVADPLDSGEDQEDESSD